MSKHLQNITKPLLKWFHDNKRDLPWRKDQTPYHVWISEIMLQQTRIEAVKSHYIDFIHELPDIKSLSLVPEDQLLKLWEGLGYYSRARNLKKSAEMIMQEYNGEFPSSYEQLRKLPGIGEYTAGAIASLCFHEKVTAIDGNVLRIIARVTGRKKNVLLPEMKRDVDKMLTLILPDEPGIFNEALMELGETICLPNGTPKCTICPLQVECIAYRDHLTSEIPVRIKKVKRRKEERTVLLLLTPDNKIAIEKRPEKGLLSGMYQFPNFDGFGSDETIKTWLQQYGLNVTGISFLKDSKHVFTHIDWYMKGYLVTISEACDHFLWVSQEELFNQYALPTAFQTFLKLMLKE